MAYKVVAPYVTLKVPTKEAGGYQMVGFYAGAPVPEDIEPANLQHHLDAGLVVHEDDPVAEVFAVPAGTPLPGRPPNVPVTESTLIGQPVPPLPDELLAAGDVAPKDTSASVERSAAAFEERPSGQQAVASERLRQVGDQPQGNASQEKWADYHARQLVSSGVPEQDAREQAQGMSRDEIRALYS